MKHISNRYILEESLVPLDRGLLYRGKDLSLQRIVFIYVIPNQEKTFAESYIQQIGKSAQRANNPQFMHVFDVEIDHEYMYVIMKNAEGRSLQQFIHTNFLSFQEAATLIVDLGQTLMEAAEELPLDFSISSNNIWISDDLRITIINTWDKSEHNHRLSKELSFILYQLVTQTDKVPMETDSLLSHLQGSDSLPNLPASQKEAAVKVITNAYEERLSLVSFVQSLKDLLHDLIEEGSRSPSHDSSPDPRNVRRFLYHGAMLTSLKHSLFSKTIWKRISITLSLALLSAAVFIGVFAILIETTGHKETDSTSTGSASNKPQPKPPLQEKTKTTETAILDSPNHVVIPTLTGLTKEAAEQRALSSGLRYSYYLEVDNQAAGIVFKQEPMPNEQAAKGSRVTFWISKGSPSQ